MSVGTTSMVFSSAPESQPQHAAHSRCSTGNRHTNKRPNTQAGCWRTGTISADVLWGNLWPSQATSGDVRGNPGGRLPGCRAGAVVLPLPRPGPSWEPASPSLPRGVSWDSEKHHPGPGVGVRPSKPTAAVTQGSHPPRPPRPHRWSKFNLPLSSFISKVRQPLLAFSTKYINK